MDKDYLILIVCLFIVLKKIAESVSESPATDSPATDSPATDSPGPNQERRYSDNVERKVFELVSEVFFVSIDSVKGHLKLSECADDPDIELEIVDLCIYLEGSFGITIQRSDIRDNVTVDDLVRIVRTKVHEKGVPGPRPEIDKPAPSLWETNFRGITVALAGCVATADGGLLPAERAKIREWLLEEFAGASTGERDAELNKYMSLLEQISSDKTTIDRAISKFKAHRDSAQIHRAVVLCLDVMVADGRITKPELSTISRVCIASAIHREEYARMMDLRLLKIPAAGFEDGIEEALLGVDILGSPGEARVQLRKAFGVWNGRMINCTKKDERDTIARILQMIASVRTRLS